MGSLLQEEERERAYDGCLNQEASRGVHVGSAEINFGEKGKVVLSCGGTSVGGRKTTGSVDEALRTIEMGFNEDGELVHAAPHPKLDLDQFVESAIKQDDTARLLKHAWDRIYVDGPAQWLG